MIDLDLYVGGIRYPTLQAADEADRGYVLNEYTVTREYGGPEEGGWWWTLYEPTGASVVLHPLCDFEDAMVSSCDLNAFAWVRNRVNNPRGIYSVLGDADVQWHVEQHPPQRTPEHAPHYE